MDRDVESLLNLLRDRAKLADSLETTIESAGKDCHVRKIKLKYIQAGEYPGQLVLPEIEIVFDY